MRAVSCRASSGCPAVGLHVWLNDERLCVLLRGTVRVATFVAHPAYFPRKV